MTKAHLSISCLFYALPFNWEGERFLHSFKPQRKGKNLKNKNS